MAGEKSGDNRPFQLLTILITSIVAPITVWLVTNTLSPKINPPDPTAAPPAAQTLVQAAQAEVGNVIALYPGPTEILNIQTAPVQTQAAPESLAAITQTQPVLTTSAGNFPAGSPVVSGSLELTVKPGDVELNNDRIFLTMHIRNRGDRDETLVFTVQAVTVTDQTGKVYEPLMGEGGKACKTADLKREKRVRIAPGQEVTLHPAVRKDRSDWCGKDSALILPVFVGPVAEDIQSLTVEVNGLGPFIGIAVDVPVQ